MKQVAFVSDRLGLKSARILVQGAGLLIVFVGMGYWGGVAHSNNALFYLGIGNLIGLLALFGIIVWWLYFSHLSVKVQPITHSTNFLQTIIFLVTGSILLLLTGSFWDEVWHRRYGSGAAINDLLWPPHLMIYGSMAITSMIAIGALVLALNGSGDLRTRFRSEPRIGLLGLAAAYATFSAPCDYIWHQIYGVDISAWSLPHLFLVTSSALVLLVTMSLQLSLLPPSSWRGLAQFRWQEVLALLLIAFALIEVMTITLTEWDGHTAIGQLGANGTSQAAFWSRPEWLYAPVLIGTALIFQVIALHALRRAGVATLVIVIVLGERFIFFSAFNIWNAPIHMSFTTSLLMLPSAIALDIWYAVRTCQSDTIFTLVGGNILAAIVFLLVALPLIPALLVYPRITSTTILPMIVSSFLMSIWAGGLGASIGGWLASLDRPTAAMPAISPRFRWAVSMAFVAFIIGAITFVAIAPSPHT